MDEADRRTRQEKVPPSGRSRASSTLLLWVLIAGSSLTACSEAEEAPRFDVILRNGTIFDGSGGPRYRADVGIRDGYIMEVGDLQASAGSREIDAEGLFVAPGFMNMHGHSTPSELARAENLLRQGVTSEFLFPDGGGPVRPWEELEELEEGGLAVNIGGFIGFGAVWSEVVGLEDRRPTADETERMREMVGRALDRGAWGVTTNLDAAPQTYATTDEIVAVLEVADGRRAAYQSHLRSEGTELIEALAEAIEIGERAGLVPLWTHAKAEGPTNWGKSVEALRLLDEAAARGTYVAGDVYPYLAGQSSLGRRFIPRWAADGGFDVMLDRFADPGLRPRIGREAEALISERVGGPENILIRAGEQRNRYLDEVAEAMGVSAGEAAIRILEEHGSDLRMNYWFGEDGDLVRILEHPNIAAGCDCGATDSEDTHPRNYGAFPRFLAEYVRERNVLGYEGMVRKMSGLPATQMGLADRGFIADGMVADLVVFNPEIVIDRATFEDPRQYAEGIEYVLVNGRLALDEGELTGLRSGRALWRSAHLPVRPMSADRTASTRGEGALNGAGGGAERPATRISFSVRQEAGDLTGATGRFLLEEGAGRRLEALRIGQVQATDAWASFTGVGRLEEGEDVLDVPFVVFVEETDPSRPGGDPTVTIRIGDREPIRGAVGSDGSVSVRLEP